MNSRIVLTRLNQQALTYALLLTHIYTSKLFAGHTLMLILAQEFWDKYQLVPKKIFNDRNKGDGRKSGKRFFKKV